MHSGRDGRVAAAITDADFAAAMARLGPLPAAPVVAVAVSGGADSLALTLLADRWTRARRIGLLALTVDHRLRPGASAEAARVHAMVSRRGIPHQVLVWQRDEPAGSGQTIATGIQAKARTARYRLLQDAARIAGAIVLLVGHTADDQAETVAMRARRQSDGVGLAGMAAIHPLDHVLVCRPLLWCSRARTAVTVRAFGLHPVEDPSNTDRRFERVRTRALLALRPERSRSLLARVGAAVRVRRSLETRVAGLMGAAVTLSPAGYAVLDRSALMAAEEGVATALVLGLLGAIGAGPYPPARTAVERLVRWCRAEDWQQGCGRTLAGCLVRRRRREILVMREPAAVVSARSLDLWSHGGPRWDGRWWLSPPGLEPGGVTDRSEEWVVAALGPHRKATLPADLRGFPAPARQALPVLRGPEAALVLPVLGGGDGAPPGRLPVRFIPQHPAARGPFGVVSSPKALI